ncbi:MAG: hypothetical protein ACO1N4_06800 [Pedobacter sp.]
MFNAKFFLFPFLLTGFILQSCVSKPDKQTKSTAEKLLEANTVAPAVNIGGQKDTVFFKDTFVFDSYNDNGDYMILNAKKGKDLYGFINDENNDRSLLKGDICELLGRKILYSFQEMEKHQKLQIGLFPLPKLKTVMFQN